MIITKFEKTIIPHTPDGLKYANDLEEILKEAYCFKSRSFDTQVIIIESEYHFVLKGDEGDGIHS